MDMFSCLILSAIVVVTYLLAYKFLSFCRDKYVKFKLQKYSDKRKFYVSEVVWLNRHKFIITSYEIRSYNLDINLELQPVNYPVSFLRTKVDSREVKKVVRMYAELGEGNENL